MAAAMPAPSPNSSPCPSSQLPSSLRPSSSARIRQGLQAAGLGLGLGLGLVLVPRLVRHRAALAASFWATLSMQNESFCFCESPMFSSLSLGFADKGLVDHQRTGAEFPPTLSHGKTQLAGIGLRKKNILGLKSIVVYAFGVYADADTLNEKLGEKYAKIVPEKLKQDKAFYEDIVNGDIDLAVRLVIVYSKLKIGSVRSAFEESLGGRIKKFTGSENKELLQRFTTLFKDEFQLPRGTTIDIIRSPGHVLHTRIDDKEVGSVQSEILCRSFFDLYIGDEPFDKDGKLSIGGNLASMLSR